MRNKLWIFVSLLLVIALALAACGRSPAAEAPAEAPAAAEPAEPPAEEEAPEPTEAPVEEAAAEPTEAPVEEAAPAVSGPTLTIWADEVSAPVLDGLSDAFAAENGIQIDVVQKGFDDLRNDFKVAAPTGEGPDILLGAHDWLGELNASGLLAEVSWAIRRILRPNTVEVFPTAIYGMPVSAENVAFCHNTNWRRPRLPGR